MEPLTTSHTLACPNMTCISILQRCHPPASGFFIVLMPLKTMVGMAVMMDEIRAGELGAPQGLEELWAHNLLNEMVQVHVQPEKSSKLHMYMMRRWALQQTSNKWEVINPVDMQNPAA